MCFCTPTIRTPWCGRGTCMPPVPSGPAVTTFSRPEAIRAMDGPALTQLAWTLGLGPQDGKVDSDEDGCPLYRFPVHCPDTQGVDWCRWEPDGTPAQAHAVFAHLRARGWTTSCAWFGDDRQYGEAWIGCHGRRAYSVQWPRDVPTEALALLLVACLAVVNEEEAAHGHA